MFKITARTVLELGAERTSSDIRDFYDTVKHGFAAGTTQGLEQHYDGAMPRHT